VGESFQLKLSQARERLPLRRLMEQYGKAPANGNWKSFGKCPFCDEKQCAGVFNRGGQDWFKCQHTSCSTGTKALDAVGFLAMVLSLDRKSAAITYLKEAGVWDEGERLPPSVMPGKRGRKRTLPDTNEGARGETPLPLSETDLSSEAAPSLPSSAAATELEGGNQPSPSSTRIDGINLESVPMSPGTPPVADCADASPDGRAPGDAPLAGAASVAGPAEATGEAAIFKQSGEVTETANTLAKREGAGDGELTQT
jgi:hypothetical protein